MVPLDARSPAADEARGARQVICSGKNKPAETSRLIVLPQLAMIARALDGDVAGRDSVLAPGPDHSRRDRSLSVRLSGATSDGFVVFSHAGDDWRVCRDHVRAALGMVTPTWHRGVKRRSVEPRDDGAGERTAFALQLWRYAHDPKGTIVESYLRSRALTLPRDIAGDVLRFHPTLKFGGACVGGMVALMRDVRTNQACGIHRTFLGGDGRKLDRKMLGRARGAAIKLDADENVTLGLTIGEGLETCLAARLAGFRPVWALGSAGAIAAFSVLPGVEAITILGEAGDGGANDRAARACASHWIAAGKEAFIVAPLVGGDLNDVWREAMR